MDDEFGKNEYENSTGIWILNVWIPDLLFQYSNGKKSRDGLGNLNTEQVFKILNTRPELKCFWMSFWTPIEYQTIQLPDSFGSFENRISSVLCSGGWKYKSVLQSLKRPTNIYLYINSICRCNYWRVDERTRPIWWRACRSIDNKRGPLFRKADKFVRRIVETRVNSMLKVRRSGYVDLLFLFWKHFVQTET